MKVVSERDWLEKLSAANGELVLTHYGYTNHAFQSVPIVKRTLDIHLLWLVVDLSFNGRINSVAIELEPGSFLWIRPGAIHSFTIPQGLRTYRVRIDLSQGGAQFSPREPWLLARNAGEPRTPWEELIHELEVNEEHRAQRLRMLVGTICLQALRKGNASEATSMLTTLQRRKIQHLAVEGFSKGIKPSHFADELNLSHAYFSRLFKQTYGISPSAWILRERLKQAATLLTETDQRISTIADACGFEDPNLFSPQFRKIYRISPREYRRH